MPGNTASGMGATRTASDKAIADIVKMSPRRVTVSLTLPVTGSAERPAITLEWVREDVNMPLSALLQQIEAYVSEFRSG